MIRLASYILSLLLVYQYTFATPNSQTWLFKQRIKFVSSEAEPVTLFANLRFKQDLSVDMLNGPNICAGSINRWRRGRVLFLVYNTEFGIGIFDQKTGKSQRVSMLWEPSEKKGIIHHPIEQILNRCFSKGSSISHMSHCYENVFRITKKEIGRVIQNLKQFPGLNESVANMKIAVDNYINNMNLVDELLGEWCYGPGCVSNDNGRKLQLYRSILNQLYRLEYSKYQAQEAALNYEKHDQPLNQALIKIVPEVLVHCDICHSNCWEID